MNMNQEIQSQIDRAKELLTELKQACNQDLHNQTISEKTKNLTQEVLVKMRSIFDQAMYLFFEKEIKPSLKNEEVQMARIYFPIVTDKNALKSTLGRGKMADLEQTHSKIFQFIESIQPYKDSKYKWMEHFSKFANEKHVRLTPQKRFEQERITVTGQGGGSVSWTPQNVRFGFGGVKIMGAPVDPTTQNIVPTPGVTSKRERWVSFLLEDSNVNSLWLCETVVNEGEKIISKFTKLF